MYNTIYTPGADSDDHRLKAIQQSLMINGAVSVAISNMYELSDRTLHFGEKQKSLYLIFRVIWVEYI